jgi:DNA-binding winged helix-turn-helix (wHTH) protein
MATRTSDDDRAVRVGPTELAVLAALVRAGHRVVSRQELAEASGLTDRSARRVDGAIVGLRRALGADAIRTVRQRGWMLQAEAAQRAMAVLDGEAGRA